MSMQQQELDFAHVMHVMGSAGPYPIEAYSFVREGLSFTAETVHGDPETLPELDRHVSGQQLCMGLRDYAIERYGLLAPAVMEHWRIRRTDDFGRIVFAMIDAGVMSSTADDRIEDFRGVFDFTEAFCEQELLARLGDEVDPAAGPACGPALDPAHDPVHDPDDGEE